AIFVSSLVLPAILTSATTLPEDYDLKPAELKPSEVDPALAKWFEEHAQVRSPLNLDSTSFGKVISGTKGIENLFLRLRYANTAGKEEQKVLDEVMAELAKYQEALEKKETTLEPMFPYLLEEILQSSKISKDNAKTVRTQLSQI